MIYGTFGETGMNLKAEQERTLAAPVMRANLLLRGMYLMMDILYGRKRSLAKFRVVEMLARYPYQAWEYVSYSRVTGVFLRGRAVADGEIAELNRIVELGRKAQDNEQLHLALIEEIMARKGMKQGLVFPPFVPALMALGYRLLSRALYLLKPEWSFSMNARFESHAEHEYMRLVREHPEWETERAESRYFGSGYEAQPTLADLFRRIGLDERDHMRESMEEYERLTARPLK